ncbi:MAG: hypothetical protein LBE91_18930 [Tannerella sp.]|jgi:hypothetical protein|nr:hypothetical protein [Tannerella sp.]
MKLEEVENPIGLLLRIDGNAIGYVTLANIKKEDIPEIKKSFGNTKGIIIAIRNLSC